MKISIIIAWICNLIDMASTLYLCGNGYAVEVNPLMHWLLQWPLAFAMVKIGVMTALVVWIWHSRDSRYARIAAVVAAVIYGGISVYYVTIFGMLY